ncbi:MAG: hypothetical protein JWN03_613 [Nocardia sp.]|uniref:hypothetical protein n=1 Tax=Nocardia sp. TaxID=1821 RepID=UPI002633CC54|nr:hypothetical protein [Nocardia sp.]MCU1640338.1 hypothetical protein [Nocardia sp.]
MNAESHGRLSTILAISTLIIAFTAGCSASSSTPKPSLTASSSTPGPTSISATATGTTSAVPPATSGILTQSFVGTGSVGHVNYGFIDPGSGKYSQVASFDVSTCANTCDTGNTLSVSPDLKRFAFTKKVDGHDSAGWIDASGTFTNVTPASALGPFGGTQPDFESIGFDGASNFYYRQPGSPVDNYYEIPAGATSNPQAVAHGHLGGPYLNYDGTIVFPTADCGTLIWLGGPNKVIDAKDTQVYRSDVVKDPATNCFTASNRTPLLPTTNTAVLTNPVSNHDGTQIAFKYLDPQGTGQTSVYVITVDGSSPPKKLDLPTITNAQLSSMTLMKWL